MIDRDLVSIYLRDHLAGARVGIELARRTAASNASSPFGGELATISREIEEDERSLSEVMKRLGIRPDPLKLGSAWLGEKVGRLKLNGRLRGYSPLSRLLELEGLVIGVSGKLELWRSLQATNELQQRLEGIDLDGLIKRAEDQRARLERLHEVAARVALSGNGGGSPEAGSS
jgi:hypothetical protein